MAKIKSIQTEHAERKKFHEELDKKLKLFQKINYLIKRKNPATHGIGLQ
ncbi:MAG: hypothetical protein R2860_08200 [Desulfobacterales bacterium]